MYCVGLSGDVYCNQSSMLAAILLKIIDWFIDWIRKPEEAIYNIRLFMKIIRTVLSAACGWCLVSRTDHNLFVSPTFRRRMTLTKFPLSSIESMSTSTPVFSKVCLQSTAQNSYMILRCAAWQKNFFTFLSDCNNRILANDIP